MIVALCMAMAIHGMPVEVRRRSDDAPDIEADLGRAHRLAHLLDAQFSIAGFRFGIDAIVGLIPVAGDTAALLGALYPIYLARKYKLDPRVERKMLRNVLLDYVVGLVPLAGDIFDVAFKANLKNVRLLEQAVTSWEHRRSACQS